MTRAEEGAAPAAGGPSATATWPAAGARGPRPERGVQAPALPEEGDLLGGRFLLRRLLGTGATGVVFEALDQVAQQQVALKLIRPEAVLGNGLERLVGPEKRPLVTSVVGRVAAVASGSAETHPGAGQGRP